MRRLALLVGAVAVPLATVLAPFSATAQRFTVYYNNIAALTNASVSTTTDINRVAVVKYVTSGSLDQGAVFYYDPTSVAVVDGSTILAPASGTGRWLRANAPSSASGAGVPGGLQGQLQFQGPGVTFGGVSAGSLQAHTNLADIGWPVSNIRNYGAVGNITTDDTTSISNAIRNCVDGGVVFVPSGYTFKISSTLYLTNSAGRQVNLVGSGGRTYNNQSTNVARLLKASTLNGPGIVVIADGTLLQGFTLDGQAGNGGDGIWVKTPRVRLFCNVERMGNDGVRIGTDSTDNCNDGRMDLHSNLNGRHGLYFLSNTNGAPNANAWHGTYSALNNTGDGLFLSNAWNNYLFVNSEANTGIGVHIGTGGDNNAIFPTDVEANVGGDWQIDANGSGNLILGAANMMDDINDPNFESIARFVGQFHVGNTNSSNVRFTGVGNRNWVATRLSVGHTNDPSYQLDAREQMRVAGATNVGQIILDRLNGSLMDWRLGWAGGDTSGEKFTLSSAVTGLTPLTIQTNGSVGIGITNPSEKLEVAGNAVIRTNLTVGGITATNSITVQTTNLTVVDDAYSAANWNGNLTVPTKNAVRDQMETLSAGGGQVFTNANNLFSANSSNTFLGPVRLVGRRQFTWTTLGGTTVDGSTNSLKTTLTANTTLTYSGVSGDDVLVKVAQDGTGARTLTVTGVQSWITATNQSTTMPGIATNASYITYVHLWTDGDTGTTNYGEVIGPPTQFDVDWSVNQTIGGNKIYSITNGSNITLATNGTILTIAATGGGDITSVGDVTTGAAFDGTQGTTLTFNDSDGDKTLKYNTTDNRFEFDDDLKIIGGILEVSNNLGGLLMLSSTNAGANVSISVRNQETGTNNLILSPASLAALDVLEILSVSTTNSTWTNRGSTGTGLMARQTSPTFTTPTLGVAVATTLDTGQGANELYDMDQNVLIASGVQFASITNSGLTASQAVVTDANKALASVAYTGSGNVMRTRTGVYRNIWIPGGAFNPSTTNGAAFTTNAPAGADNMTADAFAFDDTTAESIQFAVSFPDTWDLGTVKARFYWTTTTGTGDVAWKISAGAASDDDALGAILGSEIEVDDTRLADNDMHITAATAAITVGGTPALHDFVLFKVRRDPADAGDTKTGDALLLGVKLQYLESNTEPAAW